MKLHGWSRLLPRGCLLQPSADTTAALVHTCDPKSTFACVRKPFNAARVAEQHIFRCAHNIDALSGFTVELG
eukprot:364253-Chlamydomonas_euryale.AAC.9